MKLSKELAKRHQQALDLVHRDRQLTTDERWFVLENYHEGATNMNALSGAFFTPVEMAKTVSLCLYDNGPRIDLCAGIGMLSAVAWLRGDHTPVTCVELNAEYAMVGKKVLPEADWVVGDITDETLIKSLGKFFQAVSNPPFGRIKADKVDWAGYKGADFEYKAMAVASTMAEYGTFILPQASTPFKYSGGGNDGSYHDNAKYMAFQRETGIQMHLDIGIDTGSFKNDWKQVSVICEVVKVDFNEND